MWICPAAKYTTIWSDICVPLNIWLQPIVNRLNYFTILIKKQCTIIQVSQETNIYLYNLKLTVMSTSGSSLPLYNCSIQSSMFFQPSLSISPCLWASPNTVLAASLALTFRPNWIGMFSAVCCNYKDTHIDVLKCITKLQLWNTIIIIRIYIYSTLS